MLSVRAGTQALARMALAAAALGLALTASAQAAPRGYVYQQVTTPNAGYSVTGDGLDPTGSSLYVHGYDASAYLIDSDHDHFAFVPGNDARKRQIKLAIAGVTPGYPTPFVCETGRVSVAVPDLNVAGSGSGEILCKQNGTRSGADETGYTVKNFRDSAGNACVQMALVAPGTRVFSVEPGSDCRGDVTELAGNKRIPRGVHAVTFRVESAPLGG